MDEDALSPVIGTILLVAIAVVMASIVFVLVQGESNDINKPPNIAFSRDFTGAGGTYTVANVDARPGEVVWEKMSFGPATTATCTHPESGPVNSGQRVECTTEGHITLLFELDSGENLLVLDEEVK